MEQSFETILARDRALIEDRLAELFRQDTRYACVQEAMEYSLLAGGKRVRPVLTLEACRMCGGRVEDALPFACGVEMIHTYSLIHDDLPAMDDDELRRGRPTNHVVYGEATAILAGDGLLTAAFGQLTKAELPPERIVSAVATLSAAAGPSGMVGGQALDMAGEGHALSRGELELLQSLKTGALISAAAQLGGIAAGATWEQLKQLDRYAQALGLAFQVRDDMLDVCGDAAVLGKPIGSDAENEKGTFASLYGLAACAQMVLEQTARAKQALGEFADADYLCWLAELLAGRER